MAMPKPPPKEAAAIAARGRAAGYKPTSAAVSATYGRNVARAAGAAPTSVPKGEATTPVAGGGKLNDKMPVLVERGTIPKPPTERTPGKLAPASAGPTPNARAVERANPNAAFKRVGGPPGRRRRGLPRPPAKSTTAKGAS